MPNSWTAASHTISKAMKTPIGKKTSCLILARCQKLADGAAAVAVSEDELSNTLGGMLEFMMGLDIKCSGP